MLAQKFKIQNKERILYILEKGKYLRGRILNMKFLRSRFPHFRFSLIVSKKVGDTAVKRALIRRRIYESIRRNWNLLPKTCYDVVAFPSHMVKKASYKEIEKDFLFCLTKLK